MAKSTSLHSSLPFPEFPQPAHNSFVFKILSISHLAAGFCGAVFANSLKMAILPPGGGGYPMSVLPCKSQNGRCWRLPCHQLHLRVVLRATLARYSFLHRSRYA